MIKVFLNKIIPEAGMSLLKTSNTIELIQPHKDDLSRKEWMEYCKRADVVAIVGKYLFDEDFFKQCPHVKAIALFSVGYDHVDIEEATRRGIAVSNTPEVLSRATSDIAFLLMQAVARRASYNFSKVRSGEWNTNLNPMEDLGQELYGKTAGIFGLGRIGYEMAKKCRNAFNMELIYHNRNRNPDIEKELGARYVSFHDLISQSDILSIHASYSPEQENLFNRTVFKQMKKCALIINTARGGFINEQDLYEALIAGDIWGAGLDVTNPEPMQAASPLLTLDNVCVLPHIGSATFEARSGMARVMAENILAFAQGKRMPTVVNKEVYGL